MRMLLKLTLVVIISIMFSSCHIGRYFYYNFADINDHKKFPKQEIRENPNGAFRTLPSQPKKKQQELMAALGKYDELFLEKYLEEHKTVAFLVLKGDSLLYEAYFDEYDTASIIPVFSVAKSFTSALVGIALEKGYFDSLEDSVTKYIPALQFKGLEAVTLRDLLEMRSGLNFKEKYTSPFADMAKYYYGKNLKKYVQSLKTVKAPGESYDYQSVNTLLLGLALEEATGENPAKLLEEWIWQKAGMQYDASWSYDSEKHKTIKTFCCINLRATDLARFGLLYKENGAYGNEHIIPAQWISKSLEITNDSRDSGGYPYTLHWRSMEDGSYFAKGVLGQYLFVDPANDMVIVRLGKSSDNVEWIKLMQNIAEKLNDLN